MKRISGLFFFILCGIVSHSQTAGYLGKRLLIQGNYLIGSPNFKSEPKSYGDDIYLSSYRSYFHKSFRIASDFVLSDNKSIYIGYRNSVMGYFQEEYYFPGYANTSSKLEVKSFDIGVKFHLAGNIAPLGKYFILGISRNSAIITDPKHLFAGYYPPFKEFRIKFNSIKLGFGTNYIIKDFLVLSGSLETDILSSFNTFGIGSRWQKSSYLNLSLGIGFLVF